MESINVEKIHALKKYKQQQFVNTLLIYPLAISTLVFFCTSPFWFPTTKNFICVSIPRILSFFFSAKSLFILGNLIVIFLVKESKFRHPDTSFINNNKEQLKILPKQEKTGSGEGMKYIVFPAISREVVSKRQYESELADLSSNERIDGTSSSPSSGLSSPICSGFQTQRRQLNTRVTLIAGEENLVEERNEMSEEVEEDLECNGGLELMIPCFSSDDLKKRADDFIAMVNKQIRLEAEENLAFVC